MLSSVSDSASTPSLAGDDDGGDVGGRSGDGDDDEDTEEDEASNSNSHSSSPDCVWPFGVAGIGGTVLSPGVRRGVGGGGRKRAEGESASGGISFGL